MGNSQFALGPIWRVIPGYPGYFANCLGEILGKRGKVLSAPPPPVGYAHVSLSVDGRPVCKTVNWLVCAAFHGAPPTSAHETAHGDGDSTNNRPENLRWATPVENAADRVLHGTSPKGEANGNAQISEGTAAEIRAAYAILKGRNRVPPGTREHLCTRFGVSIHILKDVVAGRSWAE